MPVPISGDASKHQARTTARTRGRAAGRRRSRRRSPRIGSDWPKDEAWRKNSHSSLCACAYSPASTPTPSAAVRTMGRSLQRVHGDRARALRRHHVELAPAGSRQGGQQVRAHHGEGEGQRRREQARLRGQPCREHGLVADLTEPEPVRVEVGQRGHDREQRDGGDKEDGAGAEHGGDAACHCGGCGVSPRVAVGDIGRKSVYFAHVSKWKGISIRVRPLPSNRVSTGSHVPSDARPRR